MKFKTYEIIRNTNNKTEKEYLVFDNLGIELTDSSNTFASIEDAKEYILDTIKRKEEMDALEEEQAIEELEELDDKKESSNSKKEIKYLITAYKVFWFAIKNLETSSLLLDDSRKVIKFNNKKDAESYLNGLV